VACWSIGTTVSERELAGAFGPDLAATAARAERRACWPRDRRARRSTKSNASTSRSAPAGQGNRMKAAKVLGISRRAAVPPAERHQLAGEARAPRRCGSRRDRSHANREDHGGTTRRRGAHDGKVRRPNPKRRGRSCPCSTRRLHRCSPHQERACVPVTRCASRSPCSVVDDEEPVRRFVDRVLREANYWTTLASTAADRDQSGRGARPVRHPGDDLMMPQMTATSWRGVCVRTIPG